MQLEPAFSGELLIPSWFSFVLRSNQKICEVSGPNSNFQPQVHFHFADVHVIVTVTDANYRLKTYRYIVPRFVPRTLSECMELEQIDACFSLSKSFSSQNEKKVATLVKLHSWWVMRILCWTLL